MAWFPYATKKPIHHNFDSGGMGVIHGLVIHITDGHNRHLPNLAGVQGWFNTPAAKASAHFCISKKGEIWQFVDTADRPWAQGPGNSNYVSVENIALPGQRLTDPQLDGVAFIFSWLMDIASVPALLANFPGAWGLGFHSMFPHQHPHCPGPHVIVQRPDIISRSLSGIVPVGTWKVQVGSWTWIYTFKRDNTVRWTDLMRSPTNSGDGHWDFYPYGLQIDWDPPKGSPPGTLGTQERWECPLNFNGQQGTLMRQAGGKSLSAAERKITANKVFDE
jgi:hypothetical protein